MTSPAQPKVKPAPGLRVSPIWLLPIAAVIGSAAEALPDSR